jgi:hypothetical protein
MERSGIEQRQIAQWRSQCRIVVVAPSSVVGLGRDARSLLPCLERSVAERAVVTIGEALHGGAASEVT